MSTYVNWQVALMEQLTSASRRRLAEGSENSSADSESEANQSNIIQLNPIDLFGCLLYPAIVCSPINLAMSCYVMLWYAVSALCFVVWDRLGMFRLTSKDVESVCENGTEQSVRRVVQIHFHISEHFRVIVFSDLLSSVRRDFFETQGIEACSRDQPSVMSNQHEISECLSNIIKLCRSARSCKYVIDRDSTCKCRIFWGQGSTRPGHLAKQFEPWLLSFSYLLLLYVICSLKHFETFWNDEDSNRFQSFFVNVIQWYSVTFSEFQWYSGIFSVCQCDRMWPLFAK